MAVEHADVAAAIEYISEHLADPVTVDAVVTAGPLSASATAFTSGLRRGDIILSLNGIRPYDVNHAREILSRRSIFGEIHKIRVLRPGLGRTLATPLIVACLLVRCFNSESPTPSKSEPNPT